MLVNGVKSDVLPATDRGLLYGDGLFETLKIVDGEPRNWSRHVARLTDGCRRLNIAMPESSLLLTELHTLCLGEKRVVAKIIITRGMGGRGYAPGQSLPTRIIQCFPWPDFPAKNAQQGVIVRVCSLRLGDQPLLAGLKHLNRLENVLARSEWDDPDIAEGLLRDGKGHFIEGTMSNLFMVKQGVLCTGSLKYNGVAGIMREVIIEHARLLGIPCVQQAIDKAQLKEADELFICNSLFGIWPIRKILELNDYIVGPVSQLLQNTIKER